jgi:hypothetical protein
MFLQNHTSALLFNAWTPFFRLRFPFSVFLFQLHPAPKTKTQTSDEREIRPLPNNKRRTTNTYAIACVLFYSHYRSGVMYVVACVFLKEIQGEPPVRQVRLQRSSQWIE